MCLHLEEFAHFQQNGECIVVFLLPLDASHEHGNGYGQVERVERRLVLDDVLVSALTRDTTLRTYHTPQHTYATHAEELTQSQSLRWVGVQLLTCTND